MGCPTVTRKLTAEERAARAAARRAAAEGRRGAKEPRERAAQAEARFNARSTRESVRRDIYRGRALTLEEHRAADAQGLLGSGVTNERREPMPIAYDGPHQVRWDPASWQGFTRLSLSGAINNVSDDYVDWWEEPYVEPVCTIDEAVVAEEDACNPWYDYAWESPPDAYDTMCAAVGGEDLSDLEYRQLWQQRPLGP
jgi:hypothetical protein